VGEPAYRAAGHRTETVAFAVVVLGVEKLLTDAS
jgi:hypothetical protein